MILVHLKTNDHVDRTTQAHNQRGENKQKET
jgi:hypothetical protein